MSLFNSNFYFYAEAKFTLTKLGRTRQHPGEGLDAYLRRFHKRATDRCYLVAEKVLFDVCIHYMLEEYMTFLKNLSFLVFPN